MPGHSAQTVRDDFVYPKDTWLHTPKTPYVVQIHTAFWPEGKSGIWGHMVMLPKKQYPTWVPCPGDGCPLCKANKGSDQKPFPPRTLGWAVGSLLADVRSVQTKVMLDGVEMMANVNKFSQYAPVQTGLIEKGGMFWSKLDELEQATEPHDWREWAVKITPGDKGAVIMESVPFGKDLQPVEFTPEQEQYYQTLYKKRIAPWDDLDGLVSRLGVTQSGSPFADGDLMDKYNLLCSLPIKGKSGGLANWPQFIKAWKGAAYAVLPSEPLPFGQLSRKDKEEVLAFIEEQAKTQGISVTASTDLPF